MAAIVVGDKVRTRLISADFAPAVFASFINPQPPRFAVVVSITQQGAAVLLGEEGQRVPSSGTIALAGAQQSLDRILAPETAVRDAWLNKIVLPLRALGVSMSQEYTAKVVDVIAVDIGTVPETKSHRLICRTLSGGMWLELRVDPNVSAATNPQILGDR